MAEYINREVVFSVLADLAATIGAGDECTEETIKACMRALRAIPAADVAPVVHGRWTDDIADGKHVRVCSCCGSIIPTDTTMDRLAEADNRFCYFCGIKMDGGEKDAAD